eukprot:TRINITY_DN15779_c0_g1_i1.p1 TRINITY_DN15779_c0_g1~~TRINITY_DN15779_c0_g1_i1.p1  ORF type:complete len:159 (-),score=5.51 TRINITY_DN15779_c0_g1_i1:115-591(-)
MSDSNYAYTEHQEPGSKHSTKTWKKPSFQLNLTTILMVFSILVLILLAITGLVGLIKLGRFEAITGTIFNVNAFFLIGFTCFSFFIWATIGILAELKFPLIFDAFPLLHLCIGRSVFYIWLAFLALGIAGDLGIATSTILFVNGAFHFFYWLLVERSQ